MRVLYVQYGNPGAFPPVQHSARILAERGCDIIMVGVVTTGTEALAMPEHSRIKVFNARDHKPGFGQKLHYLRFCGRVVSLAVRWRPNWIYASDPMSCIPVLLLALCGRRVVYHEHDSPSPNQGGGTVFMRLILWTRKHLARIAEICVLPNENRVNEFKADTGTAVPVACVWNCPSRQEINQVQPSQRKSQGLVLFYHGSVVPQRLPLSVIEAVAQCPDDVTFRFAGYETIGHRGYIDEILAHAGKMGISNRVTYLGPLPRNELLQECARADVGLALMPLVSNDLNMTEMIGASNKPFDYLLCGLALLVTELPDWTRIFVETGLGNDCCPNDVANVAGAFIWFLQHSERRAAMGAAGRSRIEAEWNYEYQFRPVEETMLMRK